MGRYAPENRDAVGLVFGGGGLAVLIGLANFSDHLSWSIIGAIVAAAALVAYWLMKRAEGRSATDSAADRRD